MNRLSDALLAEFLGTLLLILLGNGVVASVVLLGKEGGWIVITTGWALAVTLAVYLTGKVSGGHLNPAVTLALAWRRDFPRARVLPYWGAQLAGAFVGAVLVYADFQEAFKKFEQDNRLVRGQLDDDGKLPPKFAAGGAGVFATYPVFDSLPHNLFSEVLGTLVLVLAVCALIDPRNQPPGANLTPVLVGAVVWAIGLSLGGLTGYAINPARDLGPRLASAMLGWGTAVFQSHNWYFWVPIVGPLIGGAAGALLYDYAIGRAMPTTGKQPVGTEGPAK
jgi:glycerol uptake facilitator protein